MTSFSPEENAAIEKRTAAILKGDMPIHSLDLQSELNRAAVLSALLQCQRLAESLNAQNKNEEEILVRFIGKSYPNFFFLTENQYTNETVKAYLYDRFSADYKKKPTQTVQMTKSLGGDIVFLNRYESAEDEVITYFEDNIRMPVHLKAVVQARFRLTDPLKFIRKTDIDLHVLDLGFLTDFLNTVTATHARAAVCETIEKYHPDYFGLMKFYPQMDSIFSAGIEKELEPYGIVPDSITFKNLSATDDSQTKFEEAYFILSKKKLMDEASLSYQEESLKLFEKKAEIVSKYPQVEDTLTEAEKDNALSRYLKKNGIPENAEDELTREKLRTRAVSGFGDKVERPKANEIAPPPQTHPFRVWLALTLIGAFICFVTAIAGAPTAALFMASALTLISGLIYALKGNSWKKLKTKAVTDSNRSSAAPTSAPTESANENQGDNSDGNNG